MLPRARDVCGRWFASREAPHCDCERGEHHAQRGMQGTSLAPSDSSAHLRGWSWAPVPQWPCAPNETHRMYGALFTLPSSASSPNDSQQAHLLRTTASCSARVLTSCWPEGLMASLCRPSLMPQLPLESLFRKLSGHAVKRAPAPHNQSAACLCGVGPPIGTPRGVTPTVGVVPPGCQSGAPQPRQAIGACACKGSAHAQVALQPEW